MSLWRREALERFPELHRQIGDVNGVSWIWFELWYALFQPAYEKEPPDIQTGLRVYDYALWCLKHRSINVRTAVVIDFFEKLPDHPQMRREMPRWLSLEDFDLLQFAWEYTTKQPFAEFRREFVENKARIEKEQTMRRLAAATDGLTKR